MTDQIEAWKLEAFGRGVDAAKAAASWSTDGNTSDEHYKRMIEMFDAGDPALDQYLPASPDLSGEWADELTPISLYEEITGRDSSDADFLGFETAHGWLIDALANEFERGVDETFMHECERLIRAQLADDMTCGTCGRTWNSVRTPTPAARCPFEYDHEDED